MKIVALIFSIYLLALPCLACTDVCADDLQSSVTQNDKQQHENEPEDCGSFCTCTCCVHIVSVNFQSPTPVTEKTLPGNKLQFCYTNTSLPSNYFGNIWQPPRTS